MFGKNPIMKRELTDGTRLRVVKGSPFYTIQGEGPLAGHPSIFLRLHGCNLRCTFCDTEFSSPEDPWMSVNEILDAIWSLDTPRTDVVVITGGEPMRQNIVPLCRHLSHRGYTVQIETAGSFYLEDIEKYAMIVCSPKTPTIHPRLKPDAYKYVISAGNEHIRYIPVTNTQTLLQGTPRPLAEPCNQAEVYLSPMDEQDPTLNDMNKKLVGDLALAHGVIAGTQMHKELGIEEPG